MIRLFFVVLAAWAGTAAAAPSTSPEIFAPGVISGPANDADPAITPDGKLAVFSRNGLLLVSHQAGGQWSRPTVAPFSGQWSDQQPTMSPDGRFLVFVSNRPVRPGDTQRPAGNLWRVDRTADGWGEPVHLPSTVNRGNSTWAPSIAGDGSLYFIERASPQAPFRLWRSQWRAGAYETPTPLDFGDPTTQDVDPAVAPDESFIVFGSMHPGPGAHERLYIAFRKADGWSKPVDLGPAVNGPDNDSNEARLGPDRRTLYFSTDRTQPIKLPRTRAQAEADLERIESWDNGNQNIWSISLAPWLDAPRER